MGYKVWDLLLPHFPVSSGPPVFTFLVGVPVPLATAVGGEGHCYSVFSLDYGDGDTTVKGVLGAVQGQGHA